jgi:hypothetical protein
MYPIPASKPRICPSRLPGSNKRGEEPCRNDKVRCVGFVQDPELRAKFAGRMDDVVQYFHLLAEDLRRQMAKLGFRTVDEMVGHAELLKVWWWIFPRCCQPQCLSACFFLCAMIGAKFGYFFWEVVFSGPLFTLHAECVCVCVCERERERERQTEFVHVCVCVSPRMCLCVHACMRACTCALSVV